VVLNDARRVLLRWRWAGDGWAYEVPMARIGDGEEAPAAAARGVEEQTGWRPGPLRPLLDLRPSGGLVATEQHVYRADRASYIGPPPGRATAVEWVSLDRVREIITGRLAVDAITVAALLAVALDEGCQRGTGS
jgi:8-oxo-dGTP pyrophosphatase MutT (NUDIX family)